MLQAGITRAQCRAARTAMGWRQVDLAHKAKVSLPVVQEFEKAKGRVPIMNNLVAIRTVFENAGVRFDLSSAGRAGVSFADQDADS